MRGLPVLFSYVALPAIDVQAFPRAVLATVLNGRLQRVIVFHHLIDGGRVMEKTNIERFDEVTAKILAALYEAFPEPCYIDINALGMTDEQPTQNAAGEVLRTDEWRSLDRFAQNTAKWLAEEGYLSSRTSGFYGRYTLSAAGLKSMKHVDQPEIGSATLGDKMKTASVDGAKAATSKLVDQFLALGAPLITKAMGIDV